MGGAAIELFQPNKQLNVLQTLKILRMGAVGLTQATAELVDAGEAFLLHPGFDIGEYAANLGETVFH